MELLELAAELKCTRVKNTDGQRQRSVILSEEHVLEKNFPMAVGEESLTVSLFGFRGTLPTPIARWRAESPGRSTSRWTSRNGELWKTSSR